MAWSIQNIQDTDKILPFFFFGNLSLVNSDGGGGQGSGKSAGCGHDHNIHISVGFWGQTEDRLDQ